MHTYAKFKGCAKMFRSTAKSRRILYYFVQGVEDLVGGNLIPSYGIGSHDMCSGKCTQPEGRVKPRPLEISGFRMSSANRREWVRPI